MNKYQEALDFLTFPIKSILMSSRGGGKTLTQKQIDLLQELVDKATPKKPKPVEMFGHTIMRRCPVCNTRPLVDYSLYYKQKYCGNCGQAIDWSDEDE